MNKELEDNPLRRLRQIPGKLFRLDEKPLIGAPPSFPWEAFNAMMTRHFELEEFLIEPSPLQWRSKEEVFSGIGTGCRGISLSVAPLEGEIWWVMPEEEIASLVGLLLAKESSFSPSRLPPDFLSTFYRFLAVEAVYAFQQVNYNDEFSISLGAGESLPDTAALCMDLSIKIEGVSLNGRIVLSPLFRQSWAKYYSVIDEPLKSPMVESLETTIHLEVGHLSLSTNELKKLKSGDFIVVDDCSLRSEEGKERVMLTIAGTPFFRARIKHGSLKILEHPLYYEVDTAMNNPGENKIDQEDENDDFDLDDLDSKLFETEAEGTNLPNDLDSEVNESEEEEEIETEEEPLPQVLENTQKTEKKEEPPKTLEDIPLPIVIEIGRIQMSIRQLLELQPGNMLDLNLQVEGGVDLVVHGKKIARAELLQIGDTLGVRILDIL